MTLETPTAHDPNAETSPVIMAHEPNATELHSDEAYDAPRGAFLFVLLLLTVYAIYWIVIYAEIVLRRGG